jgi:hypothetical protein
MAAPKLNEILSIENDLKGQYEKILTESKATFDKKADHFLGHHKSLKMFDQSREHEEAAQEQHKELVTTVQEKLDHSWKTLAKYFDLLLVKESTNQSACADLVVDGTVLAEKVPATFLLGMEDRLKKVRELYDSIPTLQPGTAWTPDATQRKGVYHAEHPEKTLRTEQTIKSKVLYEATKEHPAQLDKWTEQIPIGTYTTERWSGMLSPAEKARLMERIDTLLGAAKKARQRANQTDITKREIAKSFFEYIHG